MSLRAHLQMVDMTATLRGDDPDRPVHVGYDGTRVLVVLDPKHAEILAHLICRGAATREDGDDVDPALWDHAVVDILASSCLAGPFPTPEQVPVLEVVR